MIHWHDARLLHGLWALIPLAALLVVLAARRERRLRLLLDDEASARLAPERSRSRGWARGALGLCACALVVVALARPQWGARWREARRRGLDLIVALDTSNSMRAGDLKPSRLERAKWGLGDLLAKLGGDRVGLVAFAGSSFLACPLTSDYAAVSMMLEDIHPGTIPRGGTAIGPALEKALASFETGGEADRAIILITDGEDHEGGVDRAIGALRDQRVRVFVVGVGTPAGELVPAAEGGGPLRDRSGNPVRSRLQEELLEKIAVATGGVYVRSAAEDFGLDRIYDQGLSRIKRQEQSAKMAVAFEERFPWFLGAAVLLLCAEALVGERRRRAEDAP